MASKDRKTRCLGALLLTLVLAASAPDRLGAQAPERIDPADNPDPVASDLFARELAIMDRLVTAYGSTDWSAVADFVVSSPQSESNPNIAFVPLSLGNVYLNRYESGKDTADLEMSLAWFEWIVANHRLWGMRWLSAPVTSYLDISLLRLRRLCIPAVHWSRRENLWFAALEITAEEADARLSPGFPYAPYDSSQTGDSKGEEDAWEAGLLAAAANVLPDDPRSGGWDRKARQLAYNAISRPSDPPDPDGIKISTVTEDFTLSNHNFFPNPTYAAATIQLLLQGALTYRLAGREIPQEFGHNVSGLYEVLRSYADADLQWVVPSDPEGDASLFPFFFDSEFEDRGVRCQFDKGFLWVPVDPVAVMQPGPPLRDAVLNSKVVMFYLMGSYLWRSAPQADDASACIR